MRRIHVCTYEGATPTEMIPYFPCIFAPYPVQMHYGQLAAAEPNRDSVLMPPNSINCSRTRMHDDVGCAFLKLIRFAANPCFPDICLHFLFEEDARFLPEDIDAISTMAPYIKDDDVLSKVAAYTPKEWARYSTAPARGKDNHESGTYRKPPRNEILEQMTRWVNLAGRWDESARGGSTRHDGFVLFGWQARNRWDQKPFKLGERKVKPPGKATKPAQGNFCYGITSAWARQFVEKESLHLTRDLFFLK